MSTYFQFFIRNDPDQPMKLEPFEMVDRFNAWLKLQKKYDLQLIGIKQTVLLFITDKNGLESQHEDSEFAAIVQYLSYYFKQFLSSNP